MTTPMAVRDDAERWRARWSRTAPSVELVTDRPTPTLPAHLPVTPPAGLADVAQACDATIFDVVVAVFQLLVARLSGQRDVVVVAVADAVTSPVRARISGDAEFGTLVRRVRASLDAPREPVTEPRSDLVMVLTPTGDGRLDGHIAYRPEAFGSALVASMVDGFAQLCAQVVADPSARLWDLTSLRPDQWHDLVYARNATATDYQFAEHCLHQLVEHTADRSPDATAVTCDGQQMTYRELEAAANRLAHHLIDAGVTAETPVCVLLDRAPELLVALLGVLKAGGCYVPMDPSYPTARLSFMARETEAPVLLTRADLAGRAPTGDWAVVRVDTDHERIGRLPSHRPDVAITPDQLAYVIYTSGSTGQPKGVAVPHRGVVHYLAWCGWRYEADQGTGAPVHSPPSFDLTVTGLFLPLIYGKTVTLISESMHPVVGLAVSLAEQPDFTFAKLTPGHLNMLAQCLPDPAPVSAAGARWLVVGGEQLTAEHVAFWREHAPHVMVANEYGHTETSVACVMECRPAGELTSSPVSVGRPFWNTQVYIVDEDMNPVPPGTPGELLTGGVGVTRGYWRRPGLTAEKFVPNPFGDGRLYRSGDVVRYLPDGRLEFVARLDRQVKVRGFRVELGEIETTLLDFPGVRQAAVLLRTAAGGQRELVACLASDRPVAKKDVARFVRDRLPDYMVPDSVITVEALPLTTNGKVDHAALADVDLGESR